MSNHRIIYLIGNFMERYKKNVMWASLIIGEIKEAARKKFKTAKKTAEIV